MNREADVPLTRGRCLTGMNPDPDANLCAVRPRFARKRALDRYSRRDRVCRAAEGDEKRIALRVDLVAAMRRERLAEEHLMSSKQFTVVFATEPFERSSRAFDVREQEGDRAAQTLRREPPSDERPAVPIWCQVTTCDAVAAIGAVGGAPGMEPGNRSRVKCWAAAVCDGPAPLGSDLRLTLQLIARWPRPRARPAAAIRACGVATSSTRRGAS